MGLNYCHLNDWERTRLMELRARDFSIRAIARILKRNASTISRELQRYGYTGGYSAAFAVGRARAKRGKRHRKLWQRPRLHAYVVAKLKRGWSPQAISGKLSRMCKPDSDYLISHETIYASIYALPRGELRKDLIAALRQSHKTRRPRSRGKDRRGQIPDLRPIHERPQEVQDRLIAGHWEGDLIKGKGNKSAVGTLVERTSRYIILVKLDDATSPTVTGAFIQAMQPIPEHLRKTLTYDRGREMTNHKHITQTLNLDVYFADPHSPWQRGSNEHANGILRYHLPKGTDLSPYSQDDLNKIAEQINGTPRKILNFQKPKEVFQSLVRNCRITSGVALQN
jgi:transposase, IS30 family